MLSLTLILICSAFMDVDKGTALLKAFSYALEQIPKVRPWP
jgi:hypothetical protein